MVRGCQKKIIYLKSTGSEVFDEAYFVVSDKAPDENKGECNMVEEANRILNECIYVSENENLFNKIKVFLKSKVISFLIGYLFGMICILLIK